MTFCFHVTVILPAPGGRDFGRTSWEGIARSVGLDGYSWASATSSIYGLDLGFGVTWFSPSNTDRRAHGFQLRCLSEVRVALTIG
ncbi:hypothetical protein, partial [uncultured Rikenella sp.]|uniref:hypothetical protein n=1 Tax=uncultured Rikenella sp. TaxID=368003 RepID=UPI00260FAFE8